MTTNIVHFIIVFDSSNLRWFWLESRQVCSI